MVPSGRNTPGHGAQDVGDAGHAPFLFRQPVKVVDAVTREGKRLLDQDLRAGFDDPACPGHVQVGGDADHGRVKLRQVNLVEVRMGAGQRIRRGDLKEPFGPVIA
jgi:hypothetical protein